MTPVRSRQKSRAREESSRIWRIVLSVLALCAVTLALVYKPDHTRPGQETAQVRDRPLFTDPSPDTVYVMVFNGTSVNGKGREVQRHLEGRSGSVLFIAPSSASNADRLDYLETVVVSHVPGSGAAAAVAERLGIPDSNIVWCLPAGGAPEVDVSVYLGRDLASRTFMPLTPTETGGTIDGDH